MIIEPCKVCGKSPKVIKTTTGCSVVCKPFLKRTHWIVEAPDEETAIKYWNDRMAHFEAFKTMFRNAV